MPIRPGEFITNLTFRCQLLLGDQRSSLGDVLKLRVCPAKRLPTSTQRSNNNNHDDAEAAAGDTSSDTLDQLSRKYPKKAPPPKPASVASPVPLEPGACSLALSLPWALQVDGLAHRSGVGYMGEWGLRA